jgi:hypothetical protein
VWALLLDRLVELAASRDTAVRRQARASLLQAGQAAVPALKAALRRRRRPRLVEAAAGVLAAVLPGLGQAELLNLAMDLTIIAITSRDESARGVLAGLCAAVRAALDRSAGYGDGRSAPVGMPAGMSGPGAASGSIRAANGP